CHFPGKDCLPCAAGAAKIRPVSIDSPSDYWERTMRSGSPHITRLAVRFGGTAAFLLAMGMLGALAPAQDDAKPSQGKDQPKSAKSKDGKKEEKKKDATPVKLGLHVNDARALQGYTLMSPFVSPNTYLVDMQGRVVQTWKTECSPALSAVL